MLINLAELVKISYRFAIVVEKVLHDWLWLMNVLEKLAHFFGTPITVFFPQTEPRSGTNALLSATADRAGRFSPEPTG